MMTQHYTKSTVEVSAWCNPCHKTTMHRVDQGRRGACIECMAKLDTQKEARKAQPEKKPAPTQGALFGD
jgi:hypothetical protein